MVGIRRNQYLEMPDRRQRLSPVSAVLQVLVVLCLLSMSSLVIAVETATGNQSNLFPVVLPVLAAAIVVAASVIMGLIYWPRRQEEKSDMLLLCMKALTSSRDEGERRSSDMALSNYKDSGEIMARLFVRGVAD